MVVLILIDNDIIMYLKKILLVHVKFSGNPVSIINYWLHFGICKQKIINVCLKTGYGVGAIQ